MSKPIITIHNTATNEIIDREMTNAEYKLYEANIEENAQREAEAQAKAEAKAAAKSKLAALGLTDDEVTAIIGA